VMTATPGATRPDDQDEGRRLRVLLAVLVALLVAVAVTLPIAGRMADDPEPSRTVNESVPVRVLTESTERDDGD